MRIIEASVGGYDQLQAIADHLAVRQAERGLDPYLAALQVRAQRAVEQAGPLATDVRQARAWVLRVEQLLADEPVADGTPAPSAIQSQRMQDLLKECCRPFQKNKCPNNGRFP